MPIKTIRNQADLAINGALPAFEQPLHVGRPNIGDRAAFLAHVEGILDRQWLTNNGPLVQMFERRVAERLGVKHCVAMCNGTIALEIAIRALNLAGEVIVPSWTFIATAHALYWQGITPVFADIDPGTHNLDPASVRRMITPRTTGIIGVHLWGRAAPVEELQAIADEHDLKLMFDAAHAFGGAHQGRSIGHFGACEVLSFHATKAFNTFEGGALVTNDDALADKAKLMRNFGFVGYDDVVHPGINGKMPEINAAMGLVNLDALDDFIQTNKTCHEAYAEALQDIPALKLLKYAPEDHPNYHYVVVEVEPGSALNRDELVKALQAENILARKYFWPGCHKMQPYRDLYPDVEQHLPATREVASRVIVLPTGANLPEGALATIVEVCKVMGAQAA